MNSNNPYISICIPHFNRTSFVKELIKSIVDQSFQSYEICISDDCSTDGREQELLGELRASGVAFTYVRQSKNGRYDRNLRSAIALSKGRFCFLLGNDDCLHSHTTLQELHEELGLHPRVGVALTNYEEFATGEQYRRVHGTGSRGSGAWVAAKNFRSMSFVSGILLDGHKARNLATDLWDGSEMYQMYLACRIIADGGELVAIDRVTVRKNIVVPGEVVDSYALRPPAARWTVIERKINLDTIGKLVVDAVEPNALAAHRETLVECVLRQILLYTYSYWLIEYRRVQSWSYAFGICIGMRPKNLLAGHALGPLTRLRLVLLYLCVSIVGLTLPVGLFERFRRPLYRIAKHSS
jgi:hypothetical protein